jgi:4-amino-4-deoxy-L-arabinose transferase-like glycosyltransferase
LRGSNPTFSTVLNSGTVETVFSPQDIPIKSSLAARIAWSILIVVTLYVCYFSHLGAIGFVGPDEPRYAWIARDMAETGDWVTPRLYGKPWFEKPPLFYWGAAVSFKLFGVSEAAARLPSALSALLATLALAWLALRLYGAETTRWLLLLLPTTVGMIGFSHAAATDMPFSGMLTIAMVCAAVALGLTRDAESPVIPQTPWLALILFGFFLGLAVLAKGPAAIILSGGAIFFWALFTKRWRDAFRLFHPAAIAAFCLTALPWYILCAHRNPDFFRIFIIEHNFKRFLTPEFQHIQPFWYYLPIILIALLPWPPILAKIASDLRRSSELKFWSLSPELFFICWILFAVVFFSASKSKLPGYVLPAIPPLGLLISRAVSLHMRKIVQANRWIGITVGATLFVLGVLSSFQSETLHLTPVALALVGGGLVSAVLGSLQRFAPCLIFSLLTILLSINLVMSGTSRQAIDSSASARPAAQGAIDHLPSQELEAVATYKLQRGLPFGLNFYFHRELNEWSAPVGRSSVIFTSQKGSRELEQMGIRCFRYSAYPAVGICVDSSKAASLPDSLPRSGQPN